MDIYKIFVSPLNFENICCVKPQVRKSHDLLYNLVLYYVFP
jgi:hypothetical protein